MKKFFNYILIFLLVLNFFSFFLPQPVKAVDGPHFTLQPIFNTYYVGDVFTVNIMVDTKGLDTDSVDVILDYDPTYLGFIDGMLSVPGDQVAPGSIFMEYPGNIVDTGTGHVIITAYSIGFPYNSGAGSGIVATMNFRALQPTPYTPVTFEHVPFTGDFYDDYVFGTSQDCNIGETGTSADILDEVINGGYEIILDENPPYVTDFLPLDGAIDVPTNTDIIFHIRDDETGVDIDTLQIDLNGDIYTRTGPLQFDYTGSKYDYAIVIDPPVNFDYDTLVDVYIDATDNSGNVMPTYHSQFTTGPPPVNLPPELQPIPDKRIVAGDDLYFLAEANDPNGDILTFEMLGAPPGSILDKKTNNKHLFSWQSGPGDVGIYNLTFNVEDNGSPTLSDTTSMVIEVIPAPEDVEELECPPCPPCGERTECSDNRDNDGDGLFDYPQDPQCIDYFDDTEISLADQQTNLVSNTLNNAKQFVYDVSRKAYRYIKSKLKIATPDGNATFKLSPETGNFYLGQEFSVNILINTDNTDSNAADVILNFNPAYLEVKDALPMRPGVNVLPGDIYSSYPWNNVDNTTGTIEITAYSMFTSFNSGTSEQVFATIDFVSKNVVTGTDVDWDFTLGSTIDSNIAETGTNLDVLSAVLGGSYNIIPDADPPYITNFNPADGLVKRPITQDISFRIKDDETAVDINSVQVMVETDVYQNGDPEFIVSGNEKNYLINLNLPSFAYSQTVDIYVDAQDTGANTMSTYNSQFITMDAPVNHPPELALIPDQIVYEGTDLSFLVNAIDPDPTDSLNFTIETGPAGSQISNAKKGEAVFEWRATTSGTYFATIRVTDNSVPLMYDEQIVTITVRDFDAILPGDLVCEPCPVCPECNDQFDNDGDGFVDYPFDPGCNSYDDNDETDEEVTECSDGIDNDGDGLIDYPFDPGCDSAADDDETNPEVLPECSDGIDNDGDGFIDYPFDPGCDSAADNDETDILPRLPECSDGIDNDGDGFIDYPNDPGCESAIDDDETDIVPIEVLSLFEQIQENLKEIGEEVGIPLLAALTLASLLSTTSLGNLLVLLQFILTEPLRALILLKRRKWGIVYDAITKEPIDLAIVRIYRSKDNKLIQSKVTDKEGRYNFVVDADKYYITVSKEEFLFPSRILQKEREDEKYTDLYHGEELVVKDDDTLIIVNIPMDPIKEVEKPAKLIFYHFFKKLQNFTSIIGLIIAAIVMAIDFRLLTLGLFLFHVVLYLIFRRLARPPKPKGYGIIYDKRNKRPLSLAVARIFDTQYNKLLDNTVTDRKGRYSFLVGFGKYYVTGEKGGYFPTKSDEIDLSIKEEPIIDVNLGLKPMSRKEKKQAKLKIKDVRLKAAKAFETEQKTDVSPAAADVVVKSVQPQPEAAVQEPEKLEITELHIEKKGKVTPKNLVLEKKQQPVTRTMKKLMKKKMGFNPEE